MQATNTASRSRDLVQISPARSGMSPHYFILKNGGLLWHDSVASIEHLTDAYELTLVDKTLKRLEQNLLLCL